MNAGLIFLFAVCVTASFLFSGMEAGVFALSRLRIRQQMRAGNKRAQALYGYLENPERFLWTILVGNAVANLVIVALAVLLIYNALAQWPLIMILALVLGFTLFYALCELLPKTLFRFFPNRFCMYLAPSFRLIYLAMAPLVSLVTLVADSLLRWTGGRKFTGRLFGSRDELRRLMQESSQSLTGEERVMINRVLDLQNLTLRQVATPMDKVVSVAADTPVQQLLAIFREHEFSRIPVWKQADSRRFIVGYVSVNTLLFLPRVDETKTAGDFLKPALYLDQEMRLEQALREMQRKRQRFAIVLDHNRAEWGIVSLQDILKVIFGEVRL